MRGHKEERHKVYMLQGNSIKAMQQTQMITVSNFMESTRSTSATGKGLYLIGSF